MLSSSLLCRGRVWHSLKKKWQMSFDFLQCIHHHPFRRGKNAKQTSVRKCFQSLDKSIHPKSPLVLCYLFILRWDNNSELSRHKITSAIRLMLISNAPIHSGHTACLFHLSWGSVLLFRTLRIMTGWSRDIFNGISKLPLIQLILPYKISCICSKVWASWSS